MITDRIEKSRIIPVIALEKAEDAIPLCKALGAGGLHVAEITFRTAAARDALKIVSQEFPEFALGAGTVTTLEEVETAVNCGAQFAVAPGLNPRVVKKAQELGLPFFPGVCTPTDIEMALECGCQTLKYFPAGEMGGISMLKALYGPYRHKGVRFIPTGGVSVTNLADYIKEPSVVAVGGTWIASAGLIKAKNWDEISNLARSAVEIVRSAIVS
ncbi:MAG TPA: bifunctional 4-hydroxy-2-oxoglutarate aldolase/2-dehydro-3-deoxy-phosphogluconate aldolase [bacterium]|nr:bifunctional 4-hydroxy-2-oxoglutarate aldolase/2-dehydro-3-deoxy-phosphogluconate aldolase [bacterium]